MNSGQLVVPMAMFEESLPAGSIDETPLVGRNRLTEQELVKTVAENLVSVHAINPPATDGLVRGRISAKKISPSPQNGPFYFPFDGYATLKWSPQEIVEVEKKKGSVPFFLGQCKDLLFVNLPQYGKSSTNSEPVQRFDGYRVGMDSTVSPEKLVAGTLTEDLEYVDYDDTMATVQRTVSVKFPAAENDAKIKDPCSVTANQIINFDHVRGIVVDSKINGTLEYTNDGEPQTDDFEIRIRLVPNVPKAPPKQLVPLTEKIAESIIERLKNKRQANDALEELATIEPEEHAGISDALARFEPGGWSWKRPYYILAQHWILPQHVNLFLDNEDLDSEIRWIKLDQILQIIEFKPPTEKAKPWIRRGLFEPQESEFRSAARVLRNVYPEMATEVIPRIATVTEYQDCHQEWIRCLKCVGDARCVPALERYVEKVKSLGASYHALHDNYVTMAQWAIEAAKQRPAKARVANNGRSGSQPKITPAFEIKRVEFRRTGANELRKITLAAINYEGQSRHFPGNILDDDGKPLLSWRVALLPQLGHEELFNKFKIDEPWDSEHNKPLLDQMPEVYRHPDFESESKTVFLRFQGKDAALENGTDIRFGLLSDGSSNTIFCAESNPDSAIEWTKPADIPFDAETPITQVGKIGPKSFNVSFCDGAVRTLPNDVNPQALLLLIQRNDGKYIKFPKE